MEQMTGIIDRLAELLIDLWFGLWAMGWQRFLMLAVGIPLVIMVVVWLTNRAGVAVSHKRSVVSHRR